MINTQESILFRTNQEWKYLALLAVNWLGVIIFIGSFYYFSHPTQQLLLMVAGMFFITGFFVSLRIKCPKCGSLWYWQALKRPVGSGGFGKLSSLNACPTCGFSDDVILRRDMGKP